MEVLCAWEERVAISVHCSLMLPVRVWICQSVNGLKMCSFSVCIIYCSLLYEEKTPMVIHVFYMLNTNVSVDNYYLISENKTHNDYFHLNL